MSLLNEIITTVVGLGAGGSTFLSSFKLVREGEQGIKLRFGKAVRYSMGPNKGQPKIFEPGITLLIPFVDGMYKRHTRVQTLELQGQSITIVNGLSYIVDAVVRFRVTNIYNALFVVDDLNMVMNNVSMTVLRAVLTPTASAEEMAHTSEMSEKLTAALKIHEEEWGTQIVEFAIISCVPTAESQQIVTAAAGVKIRLQALKAELGEENLFNHSQLAAALVGVPVGVAITHDRVHFVNKPTKRTDAEDKEED